MEIKLKATVTIPRETSETLGISEDTPFYEDKSDRIFNKK